MPKRILVAKIPTPIYPKPNKIWKVYLDLTHHLNNKSNNTKLDKTKVPIFLTLVQLKHIDNSITM